MSRRKECIINVSVFSTSGGMGPTANVIYKRISSMIAQKHDIAYSKILHCIRWKTEVLTLVLSNYVPKRSKIQHSQPYNIPTMDCDEGRVPLYIPCIYSTPFVSLFDWLNSKVKRRKKKKKKKERRKKKKRNLHSGKKSISAVVKIIFIPLWHPQTSLPDTRALIWLVGIRGKTCLVSSGAWKVART